MLVGLVLVTGISVAVGLVVTGPLDGSLGHWDARVIDDLAADRTAWLDRATGVVGLLADTVPVAVLWVAAMVIGFRRTGRWEVPVSIMFVVGGEKLTYLLTSMVVGRPRPAVEPIGHVFATSSFPSGHVGSAVSLYGAMVAVVVWHRAQRGRPVPRRSVVLAGTVVVLIAVGVAFSRTYRGHHHPSDVVWGALIGVVWLAAGWRYVLRTDGRPADDGHPLDRVTGQRSQIIPPSTTNWEPVE